jgi:hypothetical protein
MQAIFTCPIPPMLNEQIRSARGHWATSSKAKAKWTGDLALLARSARLPVFPGIVWLDFCWHVDRRDKDPDNIQAAAKYVMDGLVESGVLTKDSLMVIQSPVIHRFEKGANELVLAIADHPIYRLEPCIEVLTA